MYRVVSTGIHTDMRKLTLYYVSSRMISGQGVYCIKYIDISLFDWCLTLYFKIFPYMTMHYGEKTGGKPGCITSNCEQQPYRGYITAYRHSVALHSVYYFKSWITCSQRHYYIKVQWMDLQRKYSCYPQQHWDGGSHGAMAPSWVVNFHRDPWFVIRHSSADYVYLKDNGWDETFMWDNHGKGRQVGWCPTVGGAMTPVQLNNDLWLGEGGASLPQRAQPRQALPGTINQWPVPPFNSRLNPDISEAHWWSWYLHK